MNLVRFKQILQAYGASPHRWPAEERQAAEEFLTQDKDASRLLLEHSKLDELLDRFDVPAVDQLEKRILSRINTHINARNGRWLDAVFEWLIPATGQLTSYIWRPVMAASFLFVAGIYIGVNLDMGMGTEGEANSITSQWEDQAYWFALSTEDG